MRGCLGFEEMSEADDAQQGGGVGDSSAVVDASDGLGASLKLEEAPLAGEARLVAAALVEVVPAEAASWGRLADALNTEVGVRHEDLDGVRRAAARLRRGVTAGGF